MDTYLNNEIFNIFDEIRMKAYLVGAILGISFIILILIILRLGGIISLNYGTFSKYNEDVTETIVQ